MSKSPGRWARRLGIILLLVIGGVFLMSLFYRLPDISSRAQSFAIDDGATTSIGRLNAPQLSAHPGKSGVFLLPRGRDAFAARAILARKAEKTIDVQYYMYHQDTVGSLLTNELLKAADRGVRVRMLTNSLASNDVSAVHAGYSKYRRKLLRAGVRLYELDESLKDREGKSFTWLPGLKKSSLHAKTMVFDGKTMFVGSFNFDERSLHINNEIGLIFHDSEIAGEAARHFEEKVGDVAFEVKFEREGGHMNMKWVGGQGGPDVVMTKEPYATTGQKVLVGILKWLPIDSQL